MRVTALLLLLGALASSTLAGGRISGEIIDLGPYSSSASYYWIHVTDSYQTCVDSLRVAADTSYITSELLAGEYSVTCSLYMRDDTYLASEQHDSVVVTNSDTTICNFDFSHKVLSLSPLTWGRLKVEF